MSPATARGRRGSLDGVDPRIAEGLQFLGLTAYEIRVYQAILQNPRSRIPEVARYSGVPQPKVYATVKRLIERGLCESHLGPINQYSVIEPEDAFQPILDDSAQRQADAARAIEKLQKAHTKASKGLSRREGRIKLFQGKAAASRNFNELLDACEDEACIIARLPLVVRDGGELVKKLRERDVKVRIIYELTGEVGEEDRDVVRAEQKVGAEIRVLEEVPMRLGVFDRKITTLPMLDPAAGQGDGFIMLEIRNQGLSESFAKFYELLWGMGEAFGG